MQNWVILYFLCLTLLQNQIKYHSEVMEPISCFMWSYCTQEKKLSHGKKQIQPQCLNNSLVENLMHRKLESDHSNIDQTVTANLLDVLQ